MSRFFNGSTSNFLSNASAIVSAAPLTLSAWFNPLNLANSDLVAITNTGSSSDWFRILVSAGAVSADQNATAGGFKSGGATGNVVLGKWIHIAGTFTTTTITSYFNGGSPVSGSASGSTPSVTNMSVGMMNRSTPTEPATGQIEDVAIWNVALNAGEIALLGRQKVRPPNIRPSALVAWWKMPGNPGSEVDFSGGGHTLSLNGAVPAGMSSPFTVALAPPQGLHTIASIKFRKTLSQIGGRVGTRQASVGWFN